MLVSPRNNIKFFFKSSPAPLPWMKKLSSHISAYLLLYYLNLIHVDFPLYEINPAQLILQFSKYKIHLAECLIYFHCFPSTSINSFNRVWLESPVSVDLFLPSNPPPYIWFPEFSPHRCHSAYIVTHQIRSLARFSSFLSCPRKSCTGLGFSLC